MTGSGGAAECEEGGRYGQATADNIPHAEGDTKGPGTAGERGRTAKKDRGEHPEDPQRVVRGGEATQPARAFPDGPQRTRPGPRPFVNQGWQRWGRPEIDWCGRRHRK